MYWRSISRSCTTLAYGAGLYVVGTNDAKIYSSPDLVTWTERTNPGGSLHDVVSICWNGSIFVGVGNDGSSSPGGSYIVTSSDGVTWTERTGPGDDSHLNKVAWNGSVFCAGGSQGVTNTYIITSPDGITWTERTSTLTSIQGIAWNGSVFCAVGGITIETSPDGITWTSRTVAGSPAGMVDVTWNGTVFCSVGYQSGPPYSYAATSPDGITWTERTTGAYWFLYGINSDGTDLRAVGYGGSGPATQAVKSVDDGVTWTDFDNRGNFKTPSDVEYTNNQWFVLSDYGSYVGVEGVGILWM